MSFLERVRKRITDYKPTLVPTLIVQVTPRQSPVSDVDDSFEILEVTSGSDPLLPKLCSSSRQQRLARAALDEGRWTILVALLDGEPVGRIWEGYSNERSLASGVPRFRINSDETHMFDLFVAREHRRGAVAWTMADYFFRKYWDHDADALATDKRYIYGFIAYDNVPSIMWHHSIGFLIVQTVNMVHIGDFIKWRVPFSDVPRFGPLSKKGRHTDPSQDLFGPALLP